MDRECRICGCTDIDCGRCIDRTGEPCYWVEPALCSACVDMAKELDAVCASRSATRAAFSPALRRLLKEFSPGESTAPAVFDRIHKRHNRS